jgi:D-inositol-3-phosphate glycosyltransferase
VTQIALLSVHTCPLAALGGKETGGMNVYVRELARELARLDLEVDVFTRSQDPAIPRVVRLAPNARVVHVVAGPQRPLSRLATLQHVLRFAREVEAWALAARRQYALVHGHYWLSGLAALDLGRRFGVPVVQMFHTLGAVKNAVDAREREPAQRLDAEARVAREADRIVAATPVERADLAWYCGAAPERIRVIPCGVDLALFRPGDAAAARQRLGLDAEPVLLFVGRLAPIKGLETLLLALGRHQVAGARRVRLLIVGGDRDERLDGERTRLERLSERLGIRSWVDFRGPQAQDALPDYYRAADLCLIPSRHESFGMVALEAMACGAAVVASRVGGLEATVQDGVTGLLVPEGDVDTLAATIAALLGDGARRRALGRQAAAAARRFAWPHVARAVLELYAEVEPALRRACSCPAGRLDGRRAEAVIGSPQPP